MRETHLSLGKFHRGLLQVGLLLTLVAWAQGQTTTYQFYPSGTVGYGVDFPIGLNNRGDVVIAGSQGSSFFAVPSPDSGGVGGGPVTAFNNSHNSAGWIPYSGGQNYAFFFDGSFTDTIRLSNGNSWAYAMNNSNEVVGAAVTTLGKTHAFAYSGQPGGSGGPTVDLGALAGGYSEARGINSSGQIVGDSSLANGYFHAFLVTRGIMYDLGTLGGSNSYALGINDSGMIAGYGLTFGNAAIHPFLYNGSMHDLGTLGGTVAEATSINNMGQVVGWSYTTGNAAKHAFLSNGTTMVDLNTMVAGLGGWTLNSAWAINDLGEIAGYATDSSNNTQLYILIPGFASNCTPNNYATQFADVSGDHLADQIVVNDAGIVVLRNTGLGMFGPAGEVWSTVPFYGAYHIDGLTVGNAFFADVDGDSKADAIVVNDTGITVRRSDGTKFLPNETWASGLILFGWTSRQFHGGSHAIVKRSA